MPHISALDVRTDIRPLLLSTTVQTGHCCHLATARGLCQRVEAAVPGSTFKWDGMVPPGGIDVKFMLMMHAPRGNGDWGVAQWTPDDVKAMVLFMKHLNEDLKAQGELVSAEGLTPPAEARIVRSGKNRAPVVTDGPFTETKEFLAGFWIVECPTAERAYEIAAIASSAPGPGGVPMNIPIEVRPVGRAPAEV